MSKNVTWGGLILAVVIGLAVYVAIESSARAESKKRNDDYMREEAAKSQAKIERAKADLKRLENDPASN